MSAREREREREYLTTVMCLLTEKKRTETISEMPPPPPMKPVAESDEAPAPPSSSGPDVGGPFAKYDKMRKMLPEGAVRNKMMQDGFSETDINNYFSGNVAALPKAAPTAAGGGGLLAGLASAKLNKTEGAEEKPKAVAAPAVVAARKPMNRTLEHYYKCVHIHLQ